MLEIAIIDPTQPPAWCSLPMLYYCRRGSGVAPTPDPAPPEQPPAAAARLPRRRVEIRSDGASSPPTRGNRRPTASRFTGTSPALATQVRLDPRPARSDPRERPGAGPLTIAHATQPEPEPGAAARAQFLVAILPDGSAQLRAPRDLGETSVNRISAHEVARWDLRSGDLLDADLATDLHERVTRIASLHRLNGQIPTGRRRPDFAALTPVSPTRQIHLETTAGVLATRILDLFVPIGFGQRGILIAPPRAGKTTLLKQIGAGIAANHPDAQLILLLIGERPEEITELSEALPTARVFAISYDDTGDRHLDLANLAMEHAKRLAEQGLDAVVLLDSATRLVEAHQDPGAPMLSGGVNATALAQARQLFGVARATRDGGTITTLATVLVMPANRGSDVVGQQLKSTSNLELHLSADLAERRIWPAIDIVASGTRNEAALIGEPGLVVSDLVRQGIKSVPPFAQAERYGQLLTAMKRCPDNATYMRGVRQQAS